MVFIRTIPSRPINKPAIRPRRLIVRYSGLLLAYAMVGSGVEAHDPVFSPGPHVLFKGGTELHSNYERSTGKDGRSKDVLRQGLIYGINANWAVGVELPYALNGAGAAAGSGTDGVSGGGLEDITLTSKYRFWRRDTPGVQQSWAALVKLKLDTAGSLGSGTTDALFGLTYGYESLKWYRWASVRYKVNQNQSGRIRGDQLFVDLAGGWRPKVNDYRALDTVWMLELNGEIINSGSTFGISNANAGGSRWFVSPGAMWTLRNFALKAGLQIPVAARLNGSQAKSKMRALVELEWHF